MEWLKSIGFDIVAYKVVDETNIEEAVSAFAKEIEHNDFPSDGLVLTYDDIAYSRSLGTTAKFPRDSIAFKWADEVRETTLRQIEWSASRTGLINPIAVFDPVELEGTSVSRASVHNLSIVENLKLGVGDTIEVYKANMIIPQIARNLTQSGNLEIPKVCPVCGEPAKIRTENDVSVLCCVNPNCQAKKIKRFALFVSRDAMNIEGLSEATLEKFVQCGFIKEFADIFKLDRYKEKIVSMDGFGEKSYDNLAASVEKSRHVRPANLIYSLGILNIGLSNAKLICKNYHDDIELIRHADAQTLTEIPGIGQVIADSFADYFKDDNNNQAFDRLLAQLDIIKEEPDSQPQVFEGKTFVITGSLDHFENRNALKAVIEAGGGKVAGSVSSKTAYLINNDSTSSSAKNKKAASLNIPVITEEEFMEMFGVR